MKTRKFDKSIDSSVPVFEASLFKAINNTLVKNRTPVRQSYNPTQHVLKSRNAPVHLNSMKP